MEVCQKSEFRNRSPAQGPNIESESIERKEPPILQEIYIGNAVDSSKSSCAGIEKSRRILISYDDLPEWYQDNEFIVSSYRPISNSTKACLDSWLYLHNESVNIYTHLVPAILCLLAEGLIYQHIHGSYPNATVSDHIVFAVFLLTAAICLGLSATYHTMMNHSIDVSHMWLRFDFVGIVILILGCFVSGIYVEFYCEPKLRWIYWAMVGPMTSLKHSS